jgi:NitT/TauT family transport system substrate-binding protein
MRGWLAVLGSLALGTAATAHAPAAAPLAVYGNIQTIEIAPVLLAVDALYDGRAVVHPGGIPNLVGETAPGAVPAQRSPIPLLIDMESLVPADLATNAETQLLRQSVKHPELRIILGVSEGLYRIAARRSAGITRVADLAHRPVATIPLTSSAYFLHRMLAREGLGFGDIVPMPMTPLSRMTEALRNREVDAVVIWEPESERSAQMLGDDLIEFRGEGVYRELFNLNTTAEKLADPASRARIVAFVRAVIDAGARMKRDPTGAKILVTAAGGFDPRDVEASWAHHRFEPGMPSDLLDVMAEEELWLALQDKRRPRTRADLAKLIDTSVYREAMALRSRR